MNPSARHRCPVQSPLKLAGVANFFCGSYRKGSGFEHPQRKVRNLTSKEVYSVANLLCRGREKHYDAHKQEFQSRNAGQGSWPWNEPLAKAKNEP